MTSQNSDIHRFKICGAWANCKSNSDQICLEYSNKKARIIPCDNIAFALKTKNSVHFFFKAKTVVLCASDKEKNSMQAVFETDQNAQQFVKLAQNLAIVVFNVDDCPNIELATGCQAFLHNDVVAWTQPNSPTQAVAFSDVRGVVFQRLNGGASTFDVSFFTESDFQTMEYIPLKCLHSWLNYIPENIPKMTSGADPINKNACNAALKSGRNFEQWAPEVFDIIESEGESESDVLSSSDDSEYLPDNASCCESEYSSDESAYDTENGDHD